MVTNHMHWIPNSHGTGELYAVSPTGTLADRPTFRDITMTDAVILINTFPPRTAIRRTVRSHVR